MVDGSVARSERSPSLFASTLDFFPSLVGGLFLHFAVQWYFIAGHWGEVRRRLLFGLRDFLLLPKDRNNFLEES